MKSVTLNFTLVTPKSNQTIVLPICILEPSLKLICPSVLKLSSEQNLDRRMTRKHNAFGNHLQWVDASKLNILVENIYNIPPILPHFESLLVPPWLPEGLLRELLSSQNQWELVVLLLNMGWRRNRININGTFNHIKLWSNNNKRFARDNQFSYDAFKIFRGISLHLPFGIICSAKIILSLIPTDKKIRKMVL